MIVVSRWAGPDSPEMLWTAVRALPGYSGTLQGPNHLPESRLILDPSDGPFHWVVPWRTGAILPWIVCVMTVES
jgi:hypothetical protein